MHKIIFLITFSLLAIVGGISVSHAVTYIQYMFKDKLLLADKVVLGHIARKEAVWATSGAKIRCGWKIDVIIDETIKGTDEAFTFFTTDYDTLEGDDDQYLFITFKNNLYNATGDAGIMKCPPYKGMMTQDRWENLPSVSIAEYEFVANSFNWSGELYILPVEEEAGKKYGGRWVKIPSMYEVHSSALRKNLYTEPGMPAVISPPAIINLEELLEEAFGKEIK